MLAKVVKKSELDNIQTIHVNLEVILRILSSKNHKIDIDQFRNLCRDTYLNILKHFSWVDLTPTAHKVLAHAPELLENNQCMGVGHLSEEGLEACHKIMRRFRANWKLQKNYDTTLKDLIRKLCLVSDPLFYSYRKVLKCSKCGGTGHQKKCPVIHGIVNKTESDIMVEELIIG